MTPPKYEWTCQKCGSANVAHTVACAACGFSANFKVADLPIAPRVPVAASASSEATGIHLVLMFFPEAIPAIVLTIYVPLWALKMFASGAALAPLCLLTVEVACIYGFALGWKHGRKWSAYFCMVVFLLTAIAVGVFD